MTENGIVHENGPYWVYLGKIGQHNRAYAVFGPYGNVASIADSAYTANADGLSIAKARADYLAKQDRRRQIEELHASRLGLDLALADLREAMAHGSTAIVYERARALARHASRLNGLEKRAA